MTEKERIQIPYNAAGRLAFDVFRSIAEKMLAVGNEATNDFVLTNFPESKTVGKEYSNGQLRRIMKSPSGAYIAVVYDYMAQTVAAVHLPHWEPKQRTCKHAETIETFGNHRDDIAIGVSAS